jgi:hypothetical protein
MNRKECSLEQIFSGAQTDTDRGTPDAALHVSIQDVLNDYGVQIMSPSYEHDPDEPKVVPREQWYAAPAKGPAD